MALLASAVGPVGSVAAPDMTPALLQIAREQLEQSQFKDRVSFHEGDIQHLPFEDGRFDLVWSSRTIHHLSDQLVGVREVKLVIKPGGRFALREGGLRPRFLPSDIGIAEPGVETAWKWLSTNGSRRMFVKVMGRSAIPTGGPSC